MKFKLGLLGLLLSIIHVMAASVMVENAYVRATPPNMPNSAAFMKVMNTTSADLSIVGAKSNAAKKVEIHTHDMVNGIMKMYQVSKVDIKANSHTMFQPGGFHVMFLGLTKGLKEGDHIDFTLVFSNGDEVVVTAPVKKVMAGMNHSQTNNNNMVKPKSHDNMKQMNQHGKM